MDQFSNLIYGLRKDQHFINRQKSIEEIYKDCDEDLMKFHYYLHFGEPGKDGVDSGEGK